MTKVVFTLVHGTFAKGADWVVHEKSETFCSTLRDKLNQENRTSAPFGAEFRSVVDAYDQSASERDTTAHAFCTKLRKILDKYVDDRSSGRIAAFKKGLAKSKLEKAIRQYETSEAIFRSELRKRLLEYDYDVEFDDRFVWGHDKRTRFLDNTETTRSRAIPELVKHLRNTEHSGWGRFVVAHSHGGNVALQAMNEKDVRDSITGVVCLATPFLFPRERKLPPQLLGWCVVALTILAFVLYQNPTYLSAALRYLLIALMGFYAVVILVLLRARFQSEGAPAYRGVEDMDGKLMVIRPSGDEASGLLRTNQFITWCLGRILARLYWLLSILIGLAMTMRYARDWSAQGFAWLGKDKAFTDSVMSTIDRWDWDPIFGVLFIAASAIIVLIAVQWLVVSFDRLAWFAKVEMLAEEAPPGMRSEAVILKPAQLEGERNLVHTGIYNRRQTIAEIAKWVKEQAAKQVGTAGV